MCLREEEEMQEREGGEEETRKTITKIVFKKGIKRMYIQRREPKANKQGIIGKQQLFVNRKVRRTKTRNEVPS
jgi:hypothetical protein